MKTWEDVKSNIDSLTIEEKYEIEIMGNLVGKIIEKRMELGLSQGELAKKAGIKQYEIEGLETLDDVPGFDIVIKILRALGLELRIV